MRLDFETSAAETDFAVGDVFDDLIFSDDYSQKIRAGIEAARAGNRAEARLLLLGVADAEPDSEDAWLHLASVSEYPEELLGFLNNVLRVNPSNERAARWAKETESLLAANFVERGVRAAETNQTDFARQCFRQAIALEEENETAWLGLAQASEYEEERSAFMEKVLSFSPKNETALNALAAAREETCERLLARAVAESFAGDFVAAEDTLEEFFSQTTENADAWLLKAFLAASFDEKIECWERARNLNPENDLARAAVDYMRFLKLKLVSPLEKETREKVAALDAEESEFLADEAAAENVVDVANLYPDYSISELENLNDSATLALENADAFEDAETNEATDYYEIGEEDSSLDLTAAVDDERENDYSFSTEESTESEQEFHAENSAPEEAEESAFSANLEDESENNDGENEPANLIACPFCSRENEALVFVCPSCLAVLTLSDLEMLLAHGDANREIVRQAVERMEAENDSADFGADELKFLGIGQINLKHFRQGFSYLQRAVQMNPNDVVLSAQTNALAIRLAEIEAQESIHSSMPKNKTILVVDDSATVRKLISGKLEKSGHEVLCAVDGMDALEKIEARVPDLILLDITMPRMDGYTVCKMLRTNEKTKDVPVVMISGKDGFFDKVRGRMAGTTGYITKPFGPETLMRTVENYIV